MTFLEVSITISVTLSVDTFEDTLLLLQNLLTDQDKRLRIPEYLSFKTLIVCSSDSHWFSIKPMI